MTTIVCYSLSMMIERQNGKDQAMTLEEAKQRVQEICERYDREHPEATDRTGCAELSEALIVCSEIRHAAWRARNDKINARRRARNEAMKSLGLKKVKGNLGGTYWE